MVQSLTSRNAIQKVTKIKRDMLDENDIAQGLTPCSSDEVRGKYPRSDGMLIWSLLQHSAVEDHLSKQCLHRDDHEHRVAHKKLRPSLLVGG